MEFFSETVERELNLSHTLKNHNKTINSKLRIISTIEERQQYDRV